MGVLVYVRNELLVNIIGDVGFPVAGDASEADATEEEHGEQDDGGNWLQSAAAPALGTGTRSGTRRKRELQRILGGTTGDALHARGALCRAYLNETVNRQILGTGFGALAAINTAFYIAANFEGAGQ